MKRKLVFEFIEKPAVGVGGVVDLPDGYTPSPFKDGHNMKTLDWPSFGLHMLYFFVEQEA